MILERVIRDLIVAACVCVCVCVFLALSLSVPVPVFNARVSCVFVVDFFFIHGPNYVFSIFSYLVHGSSSWLGGYS